MFSINKIKIDAEYSCTWQKEQQFLSDHGIEYTFVKVVDGVTIWKYRKDYRLFDTLKDFYLNVYSK